GISEWVKFSQADINEFADVTGDHQFIHIDPIAAKKTLFGSTIAHGMFVLSLLPKFMEQAGIEIHQNKMVINYGFDKVRFLTPVKVDNEVRGHLKLLSAVEKKPGQVLLKYQITCEIKGEKSPALIAEQLALIII
ncbi:MAG: MaoC family dehydratase, partial [Colwellia sp.]